MGMLTADSACFCLGSHRCKDLAAPAKAMMRGFKREAAMLLTALVWCNVSVFVPVSASHFLICRSRSSITMGERTHWESQSNNRGNLHGVWNIMYAYLIKASISLLLYWRPYHLYTKRQKQASRLSMATMLIAPRLREEHSQSDPWSHCEYTPAPSRGQQSRHLCARSAQSGA